MNELLIIELLAKGVPYKHLPQHHKLLPKVLVIFYTKIKFSINVIILNYL